MKLENQVTSLELSKKLKELRVPQESYFDWYLMASNKYPTELRKSSKIFRAKTLDFCSAYTVAELGEMLPWYIKEIGGALEMQKVSNIINKEWGVIYTVDEQTLALHDGVSVEEWADTEADARAKMLIYLLENKLITL